MTNHSLPAIASLVVAVPNPIVAPNVLVVAVDFDGVAMVPVFTDSLGNTFEAITPLSRSNAQSSQIAYAPITNEGTDSVTVTFAAPTDGIGFYVHEYSGLSTTDAVAAFVVGMGNGTALSTGDVTTTTPPPVAVRARRDPDDDCLRGQRLHRAPDLQRKHDRGCCRVHAWCTLRRLHRLEWGDLDRVARDVLAVRVPVTIKRAHDATGECSGSCGANMWCSP